MKRSAKTTIGIKTLLLICRSWRGIFLFCKVAKPQLRRDLTVVMTARAIGSVTAVLGPTNTGKTHLAIERLCGHSSGMIGFPLRLLAREVYDRVVKLKGPGQVALITGEEKICPRDARWFLCTAESMPLDRDLAFVGLDEAQLGAHPERGHVFTDRLLRARGREETMILGSEALRPMIRALLPKAEIISRPRFSTLSYAGAAKLSRLPKRSVIVAFSAEEVYAVAELLRRLRGGTAVVMGALSPRTRNAQVAMFQAGEVDYLVATDAIGMGLNMDVAHVAFASLRKFDGHRQRRLSVSEMAQIAGRAGRHQRDGSFGTLSEQGPGALTPEEIAAIEGHHFPRIDQLFWREAQPDLSSVDSLITGLEERPFAEVLKAAPEADDLAVLKRLASEDWVQARVRTTAMVERLWSACGLPDFRKVGIDPHSRFVSRLFGHLSEGNGYLPNPWFAAELDRLDNVQGDVETLSGRIASVRCWAYIAHRKDWLADPAHWADRTRAVEERLSDALHERLTQRFVDRRTTMLMRQIGNDVNVLPVVIAADGVVSVDDHRIGLLIGFRFTVAADANAAGKRLLLAAAEKRLVTERTARGVALAEAENAELSVAEGSGIAAVIIWRGAVIASLRTAPDLVRPGIELDRSLDCLDLALRDRVRGRLREWLQTQVTAHTLSLGRIEALARDRAASANLRVVAAALLDGAGYAARAPLSQAVDALAEGDRKQLRRIGVTIGSLDLFDPALLKPAAARWREILLATKRGRLIGVLPRATDVLMARGAMGATAMSGFRELGAQTVRIDLIERIARQAHDGRTGRNPFALDTALATSIGMTAATLDRLMVQLGFRPVLPTDQVKRWVWAGRPSVVKSVGPVRDTAFAGLAAMVTRLG